MREIQIDDATHDRLVVAARLMDRTVGEVVARLVDRLASDTRPSVAGTSQHAPTPRKVVPDTPPTRLAADTTLEWIPIYKVYKGHRIDGAFKLSTHEVRLSTAPLANKIFSSPTAAAVAVVQHFSGDVRESPNTNGRQFWKVAETGRNLRSIIGQR